MEKKSIKNFVQLFNPERKKLVGDILNEFKTKFEKIPGALTKHQNWEGGYRNHVQETMNIAEVLYNSLNSLRELPFELEDALFTLFLHDMDKLISYEMTDAGFERKGTSAEAHKKVHLMIERFGYNLSESEANALKYVHGEGKEYHPKKRIMNELAAFIHCCDIISARIWFDYGKNPRKW